MLRNASSRKKNHFLDPLLEPSRLGLPFLSFVSFESPLRAGDVSLPLGESWKKEHFSNQKWSTTPWAILFNPYVLLEYVLGTTAL